MTNATGVSKINIKAWASPGRLQLDESRIQGDIQFISRQDLKYEQRGAAFLARYLSEHPDDHVVVDSQSYTTTLLELKTPHRNRVHVLGHVPTIIPLEDFSQHMLCNF